MFQFGGIQNYIGQMFPFFNMGSNFFMGFNMPMFQMPSFGTSLFDCQPVAQGAASTSIYNTPLFNFTPSSTMFSPMPAMMPIMYSPSSTASLSSSSSSSLASSTSSSSTSITPAITDTSSDLKPGLFKGRLAGQEALVSSIAKKYGVSPALAASVIGLESGYGTSALASHNNFMGYRAAGDLGKNEKGFGYFSTIEKGLDAAIKNLSKYTRYSDVSAVDFNNLDAIGRHYCEGGVWAESIRAVYNSVVKKYVA